MDTPIIIAIIAILVLIIIVIVYMRSKNRAPTITKNAAKQPLKVGKKSKKDTVPDNTDKEAQPVMGSAKTQQELKAAPVTSQADSIEVAQGFINEQRYDDAIKALKEKLKFDPTHSKALLALLNVYVTTDNRSEFDKVYSYVQSKADILTLQEAKQLRASVGYDQPAPSTVQPTTASPTADPEDTVFSLDDSVDFEDTPETSEAPVQSVDLNVSADDSSDLSFAALDSTDFTDNEPTLEDKTATSSPEDVSDTDTDFDFSFDDEIDETPSNKTDAPVTDDSSSDNIIDSIDSDDTVFDLSFDDDDSSSVSDASSASADLDFDEAFGIEKQPDTPAVPANDAPTLDGDAADTNDDFSFDLDALEEVTDSTSTPAIDKANIDDTDAAFDFSEFSTEKTPAEAKVDDSNSDDAFDNLDSFDDFDFDLDSDTNSAAPVSDLNETIVDLDVEDMSDNNKTVELVNNDIDNNELSFDDIEETVTDPSETTSMLSEFDFDDLTDADLSVDDLDSYTADVEKTDDITLDSTELDSTELDRTDSEKQDVADSEIASFDDFDFDLDEPIADTSEDLKELDAEELDFSADFNDNVDTNLESETLLDTTDETKTKVLEDTLSDTQLPSIEPETSDEIVLDWDEPLEDTATVIQPADDLSTSKELELPGESTTATPVDTAFDSDSKSVTNMSVIKTPDTNKPAASESVDSTKIEAEVSEEINPNSNAGLEDTLAQLDAIQALDTFDLDTSDLDISDLDISDLDDLDEDKDSAGVLDLSEEVDDSAQTSSAPVTDIKVDNLVEPSDSVTPIAPVEGTSKSASVDDNEFSKSFGFIENLDKSQITLDLAEQYLELGEYDSAKRLITEVLNTHGSTLQKNKAKELLDRIS